MWMFVIQTLCSLVKVRGLWIGDFSCLQLDELESCAQSLELYRPILEYLSRHFNIPTIIV